MGKKAKTLPTKKPKPIVVNTPTASFKQLTEAFINTTGQIVLAMKARPGGAATYGIDGLFVAAVEALHTARQTQNLEDFLKAAAYSIGAALMACGGWNFPMELPEPEKKKTKKSKKEGKKNGGS